MTPSAKLQVINPRSRLLLLLNPVRILKDLYHNRDLIWNLTKREVSVTYQGSFLGVLWTLIVPLMMMLIYTYVFSVIFKSKWDTGSTRPTPQGEFALILYTGLTAFNFFATIINRAPGMVLAVPNYVKKVVFPLEILPVVIAGAALFTCFINIGLILIGSLLVYHSISLAIFLLPFDFLPLILLSLGLSWFLSSLGVYIRDIGQAISVIVQILFFVTPIVYSPNTIPDNLKFLLLWNPMASIIDGFRRNLLWNQSLDWTKWGMVTIISVIIAILGYAWFSMTKKGFADVM